MRKLYAPLLAGGGAFLIVIGVLFLLAAAADSRYWPLALVFLIGGAIAFYAGIMFRNSSNADNSWLPVADLWEYPWARLCIWMFGITAADLLYILAYGGWQLLSTLIFIGSLLIMALTAIRNLTGIRRLIQETIRVTRINPELRPYVQQAFTLRNAINNAFRTIAKADKVHWENDLATAQKVIDWVLSAGERATGIENTNSPAYGEWVKSMAQASNELRDLTRNFGTASSQAGLDILRERLSELKDKNQVWAELNSTDRVSSQL